MPPGNYGDVLRNTSHTPMHYVTRKTSHSGTWCCIGMIELTCLALEVHMGQLKSDKDVSLLEGTTRNSNGLLV